MHRSIEKALQDAGLSGREVTPFMRVSVVGLTSKSSQHKCFPRKGFITIWNPTEKEVTSVFSVSVFTIHAQMFSVADHIYTSTFLFFFELSLTF